MVHVEALDDILVEVYASQHGEHTKRTVVRKYAHKSLPIYWYVMSRVPYSIIVHIGLWMIVELRLLWEPRWVPCFIFGKGIEIHQLLVTFVLLPI